MITQERLKELLDYDPETGIFTWKKPYCSRWIGKVVGYDSTQGYKRIALDGKYYLSHRLAWLYVYGMTPTIIDHINCITDDNRIINLRECTHAQNQANQRLTKANTSGFKGVSFNKREGKWSARLMVNYKPMHMGFYSTKEEAYKVYCKTAKELIGEFFNPG